MKNNKSIIVFSAIQPSGNLTIGNYFGVIKYWNLLQNNYKCIYCIADLHALTTNISTINKISNNTLDVVAMYLASGVDPDNSIIFMQSHIYEHTQLNWILNCYTSINDLMRMTQFKSKNKNGFKNNSSLLNYPLLMASDILLYKSNIVPVGLDQLQHLELSRRIAKSFNKIYGSILVIPKPLVFPYGSKIMALLEPYKKMSKSDVNKNNVIFLLDKISDIYNKIKQSVTDSDNPSNIVYNVIKKPGISNLLSIFSLCINKDIKYLEKKYSKSSYVYFKKKLADVLSYTLHNLQNKYYMYRKDELYLKEILYQGAKKAKYIAKKNFFQICNSIGLLI